MPVQFNYQKQVSIPQRTILKSFIEKLFKSEGRKLDNLSYVFCDDDYLLEINRSFLKHDYYTDIITFDLSEPGQAVSGEIYISLDTVKTNAIKFDAHFLHELQRVIFHGALHLCGYKDKSSTEKKLMTQKEDHYLKLFHVKHKR